MNEDGISPSAESSPSPASELVQHARARLEAAAAADDASRLEILEDLYRTLEAELEGTRDQTNASGS